MNILFVTKEYPPSVRSGGIGFYTRTVAKFIAEAGHNVFVLTASDNIKQNYYTLDELVEVHGISGGDFCVGRRFHQRVINKLRELFLYGTFRKKIARCILGIVRRYDIDLIEFAEFGAEGRDWLGSENSNLVKSVVRLHGPSLLDRNTGRALTGFRSWRAKRELSLLPLADAVTAPSFAMAEWVRATKIGATNIDVMENFIDCKFWSKSSELKSDGQTILFAGTVSAGKGCFDLARAFRILKRRNPSIVLKFAGRGGAELEQLKEIFATEIAAGEIVLLGRLSPEALREEYRKAEICVFPSHWEPFGLVCAEAMACGCLVIGSRAGGMTEIISDGEDGWLIEPHSDEKLAALMGMVLSLPEAEKCKIREQASAKVERNFSTGVAVPMICNFYQKILDSVSNVDEGVV